MFCYARSSADLLLLFCFGYFFIKLLGYTTILHAFPGLFLLFRSLFMGLVNCDSLSIVLLVSIYHARYLLA